jgi:hypothetical protein
MLPVKRMIEDIGNYPGKIHIALCFKKRLSGNLPFFYRKIRDKYSPAVGK